MDQTPQKVQILEVDHIYPMEGQTQSSLKSQENQPSLTKDDLFKNSVKGILDQAQISQKMEDLDLSSVSFTNEATIPKWQTDQIKQMLKEQIKEIMTQYQGNQQMPNPLKNMEDALKHEEQKLRVGTSDKSGSKGSSLLEPNADEPVLVSDE